MTDDPMAKRYLKREQDNKLAELRQKNLTKEERDAEAKLLKETKKVDPIKGDGAPGRNDPCPCGSGQKYKKCCGAKK